MNEKNIKGDLDEDDDLPPQLVDLEGTGLPGNDESNPVLKVPITIVTGKYDF